MGRYVSLISTFSLCVTQTQGGSIVGGNIEGKRVLIVDDVITAGTAIRESMELLQQSQAIVVGVVVALDREETTSVVNQDVSQKLLSAVQVSLSFIFFVTISPSVAS